MEIKPFADGYLRVSDLDRARRLAVSKRLRTLNLFEEIVPGRNDICVHFDPIKLSAHDAVEAVHAALQDSVVSPMAAAERIVLPAKYGGEHGPDLCHVSQATGMTADEVIALHVGSEYIVDFMGFTPGFAYLSGLSEMLNVPRLPHPRQQLLAGSIGIAAGQCGLYALDGPGGWPIIGRVMMPLFDASVAQPFILTGGMRVSFERVMT